MKLSQRALSLKPSPTLALAATAKELAAQGHDVISLSVGEPDWDTFDHVKAAAIEAIREGKTKYTPAAGMPELRKAVAEIEGETLGLKYEAQQVTLSPGGKFTIFAALQVLLDPGDEVLIPAPFWVSYPTMVELAGGRPLVIETQAENNFKLTPEELEKSLTPKTKMLIINSPSNPTGMMYSSEEWQALGEVIKKFPQLVVLSDDIYNRLVFNEEGLAPHLLHSYPDLQDRTLVINGLSKSYSMTGWRVGWTMGPKDVIAAMTSYQSQSVSCLSAFSQMAALEALKNSKNELTQSIQQLEVRKDFIYKALNQVEGISAFEPQGAFYIWTDIRSFLGKSWKGKRIESSRDFAAALLETQKVAVVPGVEFGAEGFLRISYALKRERMEESLRRLKEFVSHIK